jgi:hypothetical protein
MAYDIVFTQDAIRDLKRGKITRAEFDALEEALLRIAALDNPNWDGDVQRIAQTFNDWSRLKVTKPSQLRIAFSTSKNPPTLTVHAVLRRTGETYNICEMIWKKATV